MNILKIILYPLLLFASWLYGFATYIRNLLFDWGILPTKSFNTPTIGVGNLSVGGTGKTPMIEYLIELLQENGYTNIAVLSRGYGRNTKGFLLSNPDSTPEIIGDEPFQIKQNYPEVVVAVCEKRVEGINQILKLVPKTQVILLDDCLQHRHIKVGFMILLQSYASYFFNDKLLPLGRLREAKSGAKRTDIIVTTKCPNELSVSEKVNINTQLAKYNTKASSYFTTTLYADIDDSKPYLLVTGLANPNPLINYLKNKSIQFDTLLYPDHHNYTDKDIEAISQKLLNNPDLFVLTTQKDYTKLKKYERLLNDKILVITIKTAFLFEESNTFEEKILNYVRANFRSNTVH